MRLPFFMVVCQAFRNAACRPAIQFGNRSHIHMELTETPMPGRWLERLPLLAPRPWMALIMTLLLVAVAFGVRWVADDSLPPGFPFVSFFPAVIIASFLFGARMGAVAGLLCGVLAWVFFVSPGHLFQLSYQTVVAMAFYAVVVGTDVVLVHWMQRANRHLARERELSRALADRGQLLFAELQHRVSNNLQVAAALLSLQRRGIADPLAQNALNEASRRLALIGRISRQLYDAAGGVRDMRGFLEPLCSDVIAASGRDDVRYVIDMVDDAPLRPDAAVPLALIVAEAIANAIEHGFAGRQGGTIELRLSRDGAEQVCVEIRDDGCGLPPGFVMEASDNLGLKIAAMLAAQLDGRFELVGGRGTTARLTLPA